VSVYDLPASATKRSLVACSLNTVFPLKTVKGSLPVFVTDTSVTWSVALAISTARGHAAAATPARMATGRRVESILEI
jgi:hypothetical protein